MNVIPKGKLLKRADSTIARLFESPTKKLVHLQIRADKIIQVSNALLASQDFQLISLMMTTGGHLRPCETKWYFVENENKKIVIDNSANRPPKRDGKEPGDVLNRDFPFKK